MYAQERHKHLIIVNDQHDLFKDQAFELKLLGVNFPPKCERRVTTYPQQKQKKPQTLVSYVNLELF